MRNTSTAAAEFAKKWAGAGDEKQDSQRFWIELLQKVYGVEDPANFVQFETRVKLKHTSFIDVMIPATHTMIEQKSLGKNLREPIKQADGSLLTPFEQAKRYADALPYSERPRWIVSCNFSDFLVYDMERPNDDPEHIELKNLGKDYYRLQFMVDVADSHVVKEMEISRDAGTLVGKIYDALLPEYGEHPTAKDLQDLNKFIVRLVFCFYAEDAELFGRRGMFHDYMETFSKQHFRDGLMQLFRVLDQKEDERDRFMDPQLAAFPYVNGSLFAEEVPIPPISESTRELILGEGCAFDWEGISPTIFGAIFESTLNPETRRQGGMHYTSVQNIHKVIDPLFLDAYKEKFSEAMEERVDTKRVAKLKALQNELASGKYFDPACGSGNFLTESYLSLRRLENDIVREILKAKGAGSQVLGFGFDEGDENAFIKVSIQQFYGIEINDFAVSVAKTAMWIAEAQMFQQTQDIVYREMDFLPLHSYTNIHEGNALRMDWKEILPPADNVKILGNPPFVGYSNQSKEQKVDIASIYVDKAGKTYKRAGKNDYVSCWYFKAASYISGTKAECAYVSTNSITQGEQVAAVWKPLYERFGIHIDFAYRTFNWTSESKDKAHVHCVIIGFSIANNSREKVIYTDNAAHKADVGITPYLTDGKPIFIENRTKPLCAVPKMKGGNRPADGGHLILSREEMENLVAKEPAAKKYVRKFSMGADYLHNKYRYCLWLVGVSPAELRNMPLVMRRVEACRQDRLNGAPDRQKLADTPTLFREQMNPAHYLAIPVVSSQRRRYIPIGFLDDSVIPGNKLMMVEAGLYEFGILISNVHMSWMRALAGRLKSDYSYSAGIVYNNFPWPEPTPEQKARIEQTAQGILDARALYPDSSLADLYDPVNMPPELRNAHRANDKAVMQAYGFWGRLNSESDCVAELMKLYQKLVEDESAATKPKKRQKAAKKPAEPTDADIIASLLQHPQDDGAAALPDFLSYLKTFTDTANFANELNGTTLPAIFEQKRYENADRHQCHIILAMIGMENQLFGNSFAARWQQGQIQSVLHRLAALL